MFAFEGVTVFVKVTLSPTPSVTEVLFNFMLVGAFAEEILKL